MREFLLLPIVSIFILFHAYARVLF
jgi:hypothetical protein